MTFLFLVQTLSLTLLVIRCYWFGGACWMKTLFYVLLCFCFQFVFIICRNEMLCKCLKLTEESLWVSFQQINYNFYFISFSSVFVHAVRVWIEWICFFFLINNISKYWTLTNNLCLSINYLKWFDDTEQNSFWIKISTDDCRHRIQQTA